MFFKKKKNNEYDSYEEDIYDNDTIDSYGESDYNANAYDEDEVDEVIEIDENSSKNNIYTKNFKLFIIFQEYIIIWIKNNTLIKIF